MGNRVKGRTKRKSVKAASHSGMGSKRKLSRMGKKRKSDRSGLDATFIGRSACLKRLQITLKDFRRLCILKGVYPREPRGRAPGNKKGQVYYHVRDVRAIAHEPLLNKFREFRAFMKKVRRAAGRMEKDEARRLDAHAPRYGLSHLVRERYPRFVDALGDLDDALTLSYLFAALPSQGRIRTKVTSRARELTAAWGAYCATTSSITKTFLSVKGVYFEANVQTTQVRWVVPHAFTQNLPKDVDYRVMLTFFEFYDTLLSFVLYKLYKDVGVRYPLVPAGRHGAGGDGDDGAAGDRTPVATHLRALHRALRSASSSAGAAVSDAVAAAAAEGKGTTAPGDIDIAGAGKEETSAEKADNRQLDKGGDGAAVKAIGAALDKMADDESGSDDDDDDEDGGDVGVDIGAPLKAALDQIAVEEETSLGVGGGASSSLQLGDDAVKRKRLFSGLVFFLSREVPRGYLELVCLAYGGRVGWEGDDSPVGPADRSITHHVVDRPGKVLPSSFDALPKNREFVQPQWIVDCANFHFLLPCSRYGVGTALPPHLSPWVDDEEEGYKPTYAEEVERMRNGEVISEEEMDAGSASSPTGGDNEIADSEEDEDNGDTHGKNKNSKEGKKDDCVGAEKEPGGDEEEGKDSGDSDDDEEEEDEGNTLPNKQSTSKAKSEDEEAKELAKLMMSKKAARLYGRMQHGISQKKEEVEALQRKRKDIEKSRKKNEAGKSVLKQKVERLKEERRDVESAYDMAPKGGKKKRRKKKKSTM